MCIRDRDVAVNNFKLISHKGNKAKFIATVSKGTYIRSLIVDLAESIGKKAVVSSINRIEIGTLNKNNANVIKNIEQLERSITPEPLDWRILFDIPTISVEDSVLKDIKNGNFLKSSLFGTDVPHIIENKNSNVIKNIEQLERTNIPEPLNWRILFDIPVISVEDDVLKDIKNGNFLKSSLFGSDGQHIIENKNSIVAIYEPYNENKFKPQKVLI